MSTGLSDISDRLFKLIPRLASTHDGEVVATARAIDRLLRGAGHDWHDLAGAVAEPPPPIILETSLLDMALWLDAHDPALTPWERKFVPDILRYLRARARLTEKQEQALRRCYARHGGSNAA